MFEGVVLGVIFYAIALLVVIWLVNYYTPLTNPLLGAIVLCFIEHFVGCYVYSLFRADSYSNFFLGANPIFQGFGTSFIQNMTWYVRAFLTGDSYLGTLYFFSAFAFIGSVLWYCIFIQIAEKEKVNAQSYLLPAVVIMCWPSFAFFTAGIGKDSLCFFLIPAVLLSWNEFIYQKEKKLIAIPLFFMALLFMTVIRPYLLMIMVAACFASMFKGVKTLSIGRMCLIALLTPVFLYAVYWVVTTQGGLKGADAADIINRAYAQQEVLNVGTVFPMLSTNPFIVFLSLPYSFTMNLIMPLFIFAHGLTALIASFENLVLVSFLYRFLKSKKYWHAMKAQSDFAKLCFYTFMFGMAFLGLINTNLGLAMRQKTMYVPGFLVVALVIQLRVKQLRIERRAAHYASAVPNAG